MSKKIKIGVLVTIIVLSGFGRDYIMVNINWIIKHLTLGAPNYAQTFFNPLLNWKVSNLILLKWVLTLIFTMYFFSLTYFSVKLIFKTNSIALQYVKGFYFLLIIISIVLYGIGYMFNIQQAIYPTVRTLMGVLQSFIPLMLIYLFIRFFPKN